MVSSGPQRSRPGVRRILSKSAESPAWHGQRLHLTVRGCVLADLREAFLSATLPAVCFHLPHPEAIRQSVKTCCRLCRACFAAETSNNYKQHRRTPSSSSTLTYSPRDDDDMVTTWPQSHLFMFFVPTTNEPCCLSKCMLAFPSSMIVYDTTVVLTFTTYTYTCTT